MMALEDGRRILTDVSQYADGVAVSMSLRNYPWILVMQFILVEME